MTISGSQISSYDLVNFTSKPSGERHPNRLAVVAHLLGLKPKQISSSRILELGCSTGDNITPIASVFRGANFVGIDASVEQIQRAQEVSSLLGLSNVNFQCVNFLDWEPLSDLIDLKFDYIFCHGIYSWVSESVREKILAIASAHLSDCGVFYLSYNALPQNIWRETLRRAVRLLGLCGNASLDQVSTVRSTFTYIRENLVDDPRAYASELRREIDYLQKQSDVFIFHEVMEEYGDGIFCSDVASAAKAHGLEYLGDARPSLMRHDLDIGFVKQHALSAEAIDDSQSRVLAEQMRDLISPVSLRGSLFVRGSANDLSMEFNSTLVKDLYIASSLVPLSENPSCYDSSYEEFSDPRGYFFKFSSPAVKTAIVNLYSIWPEAISYSELRDLVKRNLLKEGGSVQNGADEFVELAPLLLDLFKKNLVDFFFEKPRITRLSEKPSVLPVVCQQASKLGWATNLRHEYQVLDEFTVKLLPFLDGTKTERDLLKLMRTKRWFRSETKELEHSIRQSLQQLEESAFLIDTHSL